MEGVRQSGTNPTAAALAVLRTSRPSTSPPRGGAIGFLGRDADGRRRPAGQRRAPTADLLSTFTGLWTLADSGCLDGRRRGRLRAASSWRMEQPEGGFHAGAWDLQCDVEYTFYGLGAMGMLLDAG